MFAPLIGISPVPSCSVKSSDAPLKPLFERTLNSGPNSPNPLIIISKSPSESKSMKSSVLSYAGGKSISVNS